MTGTYEEFLEDLGFKESSGDYTKVNSIGFLGKYQFGEDALTDLGYYLGDNTGRNDWKGQWTGKDGINSKQDFLNNGPVQEKIVRAWFDLLWNSRIKSLNLQKYEGQILNDAPITITGMLAASHLVGPGDLKKYLLSGGTIDRADDNGVKASEYMVKFGSYESPYSVDHSVSEVLQGGSGNDGFITQSSGDVVYFSSIAGSDTIEGPDGTIIIGNGKQSVKLTGNALPKVSSSGYASWTLGNFELHEVRGGLVITKLGADISSASTPRITVKNFPFTNEKGAFGITLGKKMDKTASLETSSKSLDSAYLVNGGYALGSSTQKFFGVLRSTDSLGNVIAGVSDSIGVFDAEGNQVASRSLDGVFSSGAIDSNLLTPSLDSGIRTYSAYPLQIGGKKYFLYPTLESGTVNSANYMRAGAILVDGNGNFLSSNVYANANDRTGSIRSAYPSGFATSKENPDELYFLYRAENGAGDVGTFAQRVDKTSLASIADPIGYSAFTWNSFGSAKYENAASLTLDPLQFALADETVISVSDAGKTITSAIPQLRDLLPSEIVPNSDLAAGDQETNTALSRAILAFNDEELTSLKVNSNPNSKLALLGTSGNSNAKISLPVASNSQVQIYSVKSSDYSLDDLLDGKFNTAAATPIDVSSARRRNRRLEATLDANGNVTNLFNSTAGNSTDDGFYSYGDDATAVDDDLATDDVTNDDVDLSDSDQLFTLLILPNKFLGSDNFSTCSFQ